MHDYYIAFKNHAVITAHLKEVLLCSVLVYVSQSKRLESKTKYDKVDFLAYSKLKLEADR